jgi:hypothetical protein
MGGRWRHIAEIVSSFDRPISRWFFCVFMQYPSICYCLRVFKDFVIIQISTGSGFGHLGGGAQKEVTSPFDLLDPTLCISGLMTFFVYLFPFKSY